MLARLVGSPGPILSDWFRLVELLRGPSTGYHQWSSRQRNRRILLDNVGRGLMGVIMAAIMSKASFNMLFRDEARLSKVDMRR